MKKQQSGFTLVEIAIVMVIIGLLLGGVLKGQEVITNARIKNVNNDFSGVSAAVYSYQDRYAELPGDDSAADAHVGGSLATAANRGDGVIDGDFDDATCTNPAADNDPEPCLVWEHLRLAGLVSGDSASGIQSLNAFNGITGLETGDGVAATDNSLTGLFIGFAGITGDMAVILDSQNDDGNPNLGSIRAVNAVGDAIPAAGNNYILTATYGLGFEL